MRFDSYHPTINLIYFVSVILFSVYFNHPAYVLISYLCMFAYSVKLGGIKQFIFNAILIPLIFAYTVWYSYYNHFGVTVLRQNFIDNSITLESILYGLQLSVTVATLIMTFSCIFRIFSTDKIIYLFGRVSPKLSLFISILLRTVPRVKLQAKRINTGRKEIGRGLWQRAFPFCIIDLICLISITITWTLENFVESAASMKCRGYSLRGRTAFSIYRFDNRDRLFVIVMFFCLSAAGMAYAFNQTTMYYDPAIVMNKITPISYAFFVIYAFMLLLPMFLQIFGEYKFKALQKETEI